VAQEYTRVQLALDAIAADPTSALGYVGLLRALSFPVLQRKTWGDWNGGVTRTHLHDGRVLSLLDVCMETLQRDPVNSLAHCVLYATLYNTQWNIYLPGCTTPVCMEHVAMRAFRYGLAGRFKIHLRYCLTYDRGRMRGLRRCDALEPVLYKTQCVPWTRQLHREFGCIVAYGYPNHMLATLLLGLERVGVLAESHGSMLEDMLECLTLRDCREISHIARGGQRIDHFF
jgi:hypothetical protein